MSSSSSIPNEICLEILLRVPAKSTFVCKCVSKTWLSLISDPSFVTKHSNLTLRRNITSNNLMVCNSKDVMHSMNIDSLDEPSPWEKNGFTQMRYPYELGYSVKMIASSNGLVCLMYSASFEPFVASARHKAEKDFFFCVWNPLTREYKKINRPTDEIYSSSILMHVFGYDHKNRDYKLVIGVRNPPDYGISTAVHVYALESGSWKSAITVPYYFSSHNFSGMLFNGDFHFIADRGQGRLIVSLDISEVRFREMQLSPELKGSGFWCITGAVFEGCLSVLILVFNDSDFHDSNPGRVELWVMQDYGVSKSWTRRYILAHDIITRKLMGSSYSLRFVSASKNGEILLTMKGWLILYDPKDGSVIERDMDTFS